VGPFTCDPQVFIYNPGSANCATAGKKFKKIKKIMNMGSTYDAKWTGVAGHATPGTLQI